MNSPLHLFLDGHGAVVLFWVLSGFVLTPAFLRSPLLDVWQYLVSRWARIWIPFAAVLLIARLLSIGVPPANTTHLGAPYAQAVYASWEDFWRSLFLLDAGPYERTLGVAWSLVHEARFSLLLPFLIPLAMRFPLGMAGAVIGLSVYAGQQTLQQELSWLGTARYLMAFMLGVGLAMAWDRIPQWFARLGRVQVNLISGVTLLLGTAMWWAPSIDSRGPLTDWLHLPLSAWLITLCVAGGPFARVMTGRVAQWLGRVSYSLYLIHLPVILAVVHGLPGASWWVRIAVMIVGALGAAHLLQRYVEQPAQRWGKRIRRVEVQMTGA